MDRWAIWKRIREFAMRKELDAWCETRGHDRSCPRCLQWFSSTGSWVTCQPEGDGDERISCENCGHQSNWYHGRSMLPVSDGFPLTVEREVER